MTGRNAAQKEMQEYYRDFSRETHERRRLDLLDKPYWDEMGLFDYLRSARRVFDYGCGNGDLLLLLARRFPEIQFTGLDLTVSGVQMGNEKAAVEKLANLHFVTANLEAADCGFAGQADLIISHEVLEHVNDPPAYLRNAAAALKPGGVFVLIAPTMWVRMPLLFRLKKFFQFLRMGIDAQYLPLSFRETRLTEEMNDSDACYVTSSFELWRLLRNAGLTLKKKSWLHCRCAAVKKI